MEGLVVEFIQWVKAFKKKRNVTGRTSHHGSFSMMAVWPENNPKYGRLDSFSDDPRIDETWQQSYILRDDVISALHDRIVKLEKRLAPQKKGPKPTTKYKPQEGQDAETRDGRKAIFVKLSTPSSPQSHPPFTFNVSGRDIGYSLGGSYREYSHPLDLIGPWEGE